MKIRTILNSYQNEKLYAIRTHAHVIDNLKQWQETDKKIKQLLEDKKYNLYIDPDDDRDHNIRCDFFNDYDNFILTNEEKVFYLTHKFFIVLHKIIYFIDWLIYKTRHFWIHINWMPPHVKDCKTYNEYTIRYWDRE